jgi:selenocysteine-specific elongation factor
MIIGTAGHIDHGKTTLVKALTGVDADRLPEEKARGITLDLGYAYTPLPGGNVLGFVDVPGHEKLVHNMLAGATGIDFVLLVVAADDGPMPQTREHLQILDLLDLDAGAIALTKIDTVGAERAGQAEAEIATLLSITGLASAPVFRVSSVTGQGVDVLRLHLEAEAARLPARARGGYFRLAIDRCFTLVGAGTIVTGTVYSGEVAVGDSLIVSPAGIEVRVRSIHAQNQPAQRGFAGHRCALNLVGEGFDKSRVQRGHWAVAASVHAPTQRLDVQLRLLASEDVPLAHWSPAHVHLAASEAMGRVALLEGEVLQPGKVAFAQLVLDRPIGALHDDRFVIRDQSATRTIGGGRVLDPFPPTRGRRTPVRLALLHDWGGGVTPAEGLRAALGQNPLGVNVTRFAQSWNLLDQEMDGIVRGANARLAGPHDELVALSSSAWSELGQKILAALATEHTRAPDMIGVGREHLRRISAPGLPRGAFDEMVEELRQQGRIHQNGHWLHAPDHHVTLTLGEDKLWARVCPLLEQAPFQPPRVRDLARTLSIEEDAMRQLLKHVARTGAAFPVAHDHYFTRGAITALADIVRSFEAQRGVASAAVFRDRIGTGRKLAIQILEFFDRTGFTRRVKDSHVLRQPALFSPEQTGRESPAAGRRATNRTR